MCRVEVFNLIYPDGHSEQREQVLNTCPRGTPSQPCHHREYAHLHRDRLATPEDIDEYARRHAPIIEPRRHTESHPERREKPKSLLQGLSLSLKMWKPFSPKEKQKKMKRRNLAIESRRHDGRLSVVEHLPRAPSPPPAWAPREQQPVIITSSPRRVRDGSGHGEGTVRPRRRPPRDVVIHHASEPHESSDDTRTPSPPERTRRHERPQRARSLSPIRRANAAEQEARREKEKRHRAEKNAQSEHEARMRAERIYHEELREQRRIAIERRPEIESADRARRRQDQENHERRERARRDQEQEDIAAIRRTDAMRAEQERLARRQAAQSPIIVHNPNDFEERGRAFLNSAVREANMTRFERNAPILRPPGRSLWRRNTVDGSHRRPYEGGHVRHR